MGWSYGRKIRGEPPAIKDEEKLFEKLINTHGLERLLERLQEVERLVTKVALNLDKKRHFLSL